MISLFAGAKGKVEFKETEDEIEIAFEIGRLSAESGGKSRMNVEIIGDSPLLSKINGIIGNKKKPASTTAANSNKFLTNVSKGNIKKIVTAAKEVIKYDA